MRHGLISLRDVAGLGMAIRKWLSLLPKLRAVVFVGRKAEYTREIIAGQLPNVKMFYCPHPSPRCLNTNPVNRQRILDVLREVAVATFQ